MTCEGTARSVLALQVSGLHAVLNGIDGAYTKATDLLLLQRNKPIAVTGVGKSGHVARKVAATLSSLGSPAFFLHPTEAAHGDLGLLKGAGALLAFSRSGVAVDSRSGHPSEVGVVVSHAKRWGIPVVLVSENASDGLALMANVTLQMPEHEEAWGKAPTVSTTIQMAMGDVLAVCLAERRGFTPKDFQEFHPGGYLGALDEDGILSFSRRAEHVG